MYMKQCVPKHSSGSSAVGEDREQGTHSYRRASVRAARARGVLPGAVRRRKFRTEPGRPAFRFLCLRTAASEHVVGPGQQAGDPFENQGLGNLTPSTCPCEPASCMLCLSDRFAPWGMRKNCLLRVVCHLASREWRRCAFGGTGPSATA